MHNQMSDDIIERLERIWASDKLHVRRMLIGLTKDIDLADDLLQETYLKARDGVSNYRGENDRAWLCTIARNAFMAHIRRRYVHAETGDDAESAASYSPVGTPDHLELMRIRNAMSELDPELRIALLMKHYCGFTYREIAQNTHCAVGTAKWRVSVAIDKLKEALGALEEQMEMTCAALNKIKILDYLYGSLAYDEMEAIGRHLQDCQKCQSRLDDTSKIMSVLDALENEMKTIHIIELDKNGVPKIYGMTGFAITGSSVISFCATKTIPFEYMGAQGEELTYTQEENNDPNYPNTYLYHVNLPQSLCDGKMRNLVTVSRPLEKHYAVREEDGSWKFNWSQLTTVEREWAYVLAIRLPADSHLISADPPAEETKSNAGTTLMWRTVQAANQWFQCEFKYRLNDSVL